MENCYVSISLSISDSIKILTVSIQLLFRQIDTNI